MRSLKEYLVTEYMAQDLNDKLMIDNRVISSDITLQDLKDAGWGSSMLDETKSKILSKCDVLVDGPFIFEKRDLKLPFKGSSNQRVIDLKHSTPNNVSILL